MIVIAYLTSSLAWSALGLVAGAALTEVGFEFRSLISGRRKRDDT